MPLVLKILKNFPLSIREIANIPYLPLYPHAPQTDTPP